MNGQDIDQSDLGVVDVKMNIVMPCSIFIESSENLYIDLYMC